MSGEPDLLERVRMCLAEVGAETTGVTFEDEVIYCSWEVEFRTAWMAVSIARIPEGIKPACFACAAAHQFRSAERIRAGRDRCLASRPCQEDCGVDR